MTMVQKKAGHSNFTVGQSVDVVAGKYKGNCGVVEKVCTVKIRIDLDPVLYTCVLA